MSLHDHPRGQLAPDELDYVAITADITVSGSSGAPTTLVTGNTVTYDGATRVLVEFYAAGLFAGSATMVGELYEDSTLLGRIWQLAANTVMGGTLGVIRTPTSGKHSYTVKAWKSGGTDAAVGAVAGTFAPAFLRVTRA